MVRYLLFGLLLLHAAIHLLGFTKAFSLANIEQLQLPISKTSGLLWLLAFALFITTAILYFQKITTWYYWAFAAIILSQVLLFLAWQDAKWGTLPNMIILVIAVVAASGHHFEGIFRKDVQSYLALAAPASEILTEEDIAHLPLPVQQYLHYTGSIGQPKVYNMVVKFRGRMRGKEQDWFPFTSEQYNDFRQPTRLFFMKAKIKGFPTYGYHVYQNQEASMLIKMLSIFLVVDIEDEELFRAETVTYFNDLCLLAPAALIDARIQWQPIDNLRCQATFTNQGVSISAILTFNENGQLINFESNDRKEINLGKTLPFSTPVLDYQTSPTTGSGPLMAEGHAVWHYPEGAFVYGEFYTVEVEYNVTHHYQ